MQKIEALKEVGFSDNFIERFNHYQETLRLSPIDIPTFYQNLSKPTALDVSEKFVINVSNNNYVPLNLSIDE